MKVGVLGENLSIFGKTIYITKSPISFFLSEIDFRDVFHRENFLGLRKNVNFIETFGYETVHISGRYGECFGVFVYRSQAQKTISISPFRKNYNFGFR